MPIYEYVCTKCGQRFELRRSIDDSDDDIRCPDCGADNPKRLFSMFATSFSGEACAPSNHT